MRRLVERGHEVACMDVNPSSPSTVAVRRNVLGMDNCFEAARICGIKRVVYASSLAVYGRQSDFGDRPLTEEDDRKGTGVYSLSKIFNEHQAEGDNAAYGMQIKIG